MRNRTLVTTAIAFVVLAVTSACAMDETKSSPKIDSPSGALAPKSSYGAARADHAVDIGFAAAYLPLLAVPADPHGLDLEHFPRTAALVSVRRVCEHLEHDAKITAALKGDAGGDGVSIRVGDIFHGAEEECCKQHGGEPEENPPPADTLRKCADQLQRVDAQLALVDVEAVRAGLPDHTIPRIDAASADATASQEVAGIRALLVPTPPEDKIEKLWRDPNATTDDLDATCKAAMVSDPLPQDLDVQNPASRMAYARAQDAQIRCEFLSGFLQAALGERACEQAEKTGKPCGPVVMTFFKQKQTESMDKLCADTRQTHPYDPPVSLTGTLTALMNRCPSVMMGHP